MGVKFTFDNQTRVIYMYIYPRIQNECKFDP